VKQDAVKVVRPKITVNHKLEGNGFYIEIDLPGADKESVELEIGTYGLSVKAEGNKVRYEGDYPLGYNIIPEEAEANCENGVLYVSLPIKEKSLKGTKIDIVTT
jgi:HSP20 family molecular chaperone IbpA